MIEANATAIEVPGAALRYEAIGSGPVLLIVHGGIADSAMFKPYVGPLADRYTVVTYDRRGYGDSELEDPEQEHTVELHADDAHRLLAELSDEPAHVVGFSSGGFITLELAARHPQQVATAVAFEPPAVHLLPEAEAFRTEGRETYELFQREGAQAAMARFGGAVQGDSDEESPAPPEEPGPEMAEVMARMGRNAEFFFAHEYLQFAEWRPQLDQLRAGAARVVLGGGDAAGDQPARRATDALAEQLGMEVVDFPGDHAGLMQDTEGWTAVLERTLRDPRR